MIAGAGGRGLAVGRGPAGNAGFVARGEDCTACGVGCGGAGSGGAMAYVGGGQGDYIAETTYQYVGYGGDFSRPRRNFTCIITTCCLLSLLLLIPLLLWLMAGPQPPFQCGTGEEMMAWSAEQQTYCCQTAGLACFTTMPVTIPLTALPTQPPTPPITPPRPPPPAGDPFNCAVNAESTWAADKKAWCCKVHHKGCPPTPPPVVPMPPVIPPVIRPIMPRPPADPYNCADGFSNWQAGWSVQKKKWCCDHHGKGCGSGQGNGCAPIGTTSPAYDCNAGFANWVAGWSIPKKAWCCANAGKGCPQQGGGCA